MHFHVQEVKQGSRKLQKAHLTHFFLLPNGNYLFVEITTDTSTKDKLVNDIRACFNFKKTKVPINKVEEIILCINWNIDQKEILKLNTLVKRYNNNVTVLIMERSSDSDRATLAITCSGDAPSYSSGSSCSTASFLGITALVMANNIGVPSDFIISSYMVPASSNAINYYPSFGFGWVDINAAIGL